MKGNPYTPWALTAALLASCFFLAGLAFHHQGELTRAIRVGEIFYQRPGVAELVEKNKPEVYQEIGFDGQFFFFLAFDPLLLNEATINSLDAPHLRARRIMFPMVSRLISRHRHGIAKGMTWCVLLSFVGIALAAGSLLRRHQFSPLWVFPAVLSLSTAVAAEYYTCETLATFFIFVTFWAYWRERPTILWLSTSAAILTKEPAAALAVALVFMALMEKKWRKAAFYATTLLPFLLWVFYLQLRIPDKMHPHMLKNLTFPFMGALPLFPHDLAQLLAGENVRVYLLRIFSRLWFLLGAIMAFMFFNRRRTIASSFALLAGINVMVLSSGEHNPCYDYMSHYARQLFLFHPALFMLFIESKSRSKSLQVFLLLFLVLSLSTYYLLIKGKFV